MATKPIITIDVDDRKFKQFLDLFNGYQDALKKQPGAWSQAGQAMGSGKDAVEAMVAAMLAQTEMLHKIVEESRRLERTVTATGGTMHRLAESAKSVAGHIAHATKDLIKWSSIGSALTGLVGIGGLFGVERLASTASGLRSRAMGLGTNPAALQALGINFGPFVDVPGALGRTIQAQQDARLRWIFGAMGAAGAANANPDVALQEEMTAARRLYQTTPAAIRQQVLEARGALNIFSMEEIRRLAQMSPQEFQRHLAGVRRDEAAFAYPPGVLQAWQRLSQQLSRAGNQIEQAFITGLAPLTPELRDLSKAFAGVVTAFLKSPTLKEWIGDLDTELKHFAAWIGTPDFRKDVENFVSDIGSMTKALAGFVRWAAGLLGGTKRADTGPPPLAEWERTEASAFERYRQQNPFLAKLVSPGHFAGTMPPAGLSAWQQQELAAFKQWEADRLAGKDKRTFDQFERDYVKAHRPLHAMTAPAGAVAAQIVGEAKARGASSAAVQALLAGALGEGGVWQKWKPGDHGTSFGPWQLHKGGELDRYLAEGGQPGNVPMQAAYVLRRLNQMFPGFSKLKDPRQAIADVTAFERSVRGTAYYAAYLPAAEKIAEQLRSAVAASAPRTAMQPGQKVVHPALAAGGALDKTRLQIVNQTGGSAIVTTSALAF